MNVDELRECPCCGREGVDCQAEAQADDENSEGECDECEHPLERRLSRGGESWTCKDCGRYGEGEG